MPGGAGRDDYSPMPTGGSGANYGASGTGDGQHVKTKTVHTPKKKTVTTGDGSKTALSALSFIKTGNPAGLLWQGAKKIGNIFADKRTEQQKVEANIKKGYDVLNPAEMHRATQRKPVPVGGGPGDRDGLQNTIATQSLVTAPTADKAAGFGHQWNFQAYGNQAQTTANPYDYTKSPYAKKGKLVHKYATGQEIKNFSKGKRFGPPPLKGPDPQGLQVILENSDYFKKLIG